MAYITVCNNCGSDGQTFLKFIVNNANPNKFQSLLGRDYFEGIEVTQDDLNLLYSEHLDNFDSEQIVYCCECEAVYR